MSFAVMGVPLTGDLRAWDRDQRRVGSLLVVGAALVVALAAVVTFFVAKGTPAWVWWLLVGLLVLVLAFQVTLLVLDARSQGRAASAPVVAAPEVADASAGGAPEPAHAHRTLTLRCGDCGTVFDLTDTGERPLYHACPGCGAEGVLRAPETPEPEADVPAPPEPAAPAVWAPQPAAPAPAPAQVKRLKLRCGGCKEIFVIEDHGERPLRRPCPHCGRTGEIR